MTQPSRSEAAPGLLESFTRPAGWMERPSRLVRSLYASVGLLFLCFPLSDLQRHRGWWVAGAITTIVLFTACYLATVYTQGEWGRPVRRITWILLGVITLVAITAPAAFGPSWGGLFVYLAILYSMALPREWALRGVGATTFLAFVESFALGVRGSGLGAIVIGCGSMGLFMTAFRNSRMLNIELREARDQMARLAVTEERLRIARDLHDLLGHSLSLIVLKSEVARRLGERDPDKVMNEITDIEAVARQALADVRAAVSGYRQRSMTEEMDNARAVLEAAGVQVSVQLSGTPFPDNVDGLFGWAVREGVTNIVRHARASRCELAVSRTTKAAELTITDNGRGGSDFVGAGNGLTGLSERIEGAGGSLVAGPGQGGGFRLAVRIPLVQGSPLSPLKSSA